jgi:hypothetical protein
MVPALIVGLIVLVLLMLYVATSPTRMERRAREQARREANPFVGSSGKEYHAPSLHEPARKGLDRSRAIRFPEGR